MGDKTYLSVCPTCGKLYNFEMPDDLGVKDDYIAELLCNDCENVLEGYMSAVLKDFGRGGCISAARKIVMWFNEELSMRNPHILALCKEIIVVEESVRSGRP